ncbi:MAG: polysaccharide biosynthesis tyrosine autokinase [Cyanothece sp. SIO1E1]|nr:polysaccharide biosynthesis tyrosine autokinase [Cyanothece sp. SIO1E1]
MEIEQGAQVLALNTNNHHLVEPPLPLTQPDELEEAPQRGLNFRPLISIIQRNILLIAGVTVAMGSIAYLRQAQAPPIYQGDFRLLVEPISTEAALSDPTALTRGGGGNRPELDYDTQLQILQSSRVSDAIVKQVKARYPNFSTSELAEGFTVQRCCTVNDGPIQKTLKTKMIEVLYQGADPERVQAVLEAAAERYLKYSLEERKTRIGEGIKFIEDQLPELQQRVDGLQEEIQALQERHGLINPDIQGQSIAAKVLEVDNQQLETQAQIEEQRLLYTNLQRQLGLTPNEAIAASALSENPRYQSLLDQIQAVESEIAIESVRFSQTSPVVRALRQRRANLSALLEQEAKQVLGQDLGATGNANVLTFQNSIRQGLIQQLVETTNQVQLLEVRNRGLTAAKARFGQKIRQFPAIARRYTELQQELEVVTQTRDQLLLQGENLRVEAAQSEVPWELISEPTIPLDANGNAAAVATSSAKSILLGLGIGFGLGLGAAWLLEQRRNVFQSIEDLQDATLLPILGQIPKYKDVPQPASTLAQAGANGEPQPINQLDADLFREAFSSLYTKIHFLFPNRLGRSLVVASAEAQDGKSTIAFNLAQMVALSGQRVLLVDANLHQPSMHVLLDLPNTKGFGELLTGQGDPKEFIQHLSVPANLSVLTSGQTESDPTALLASARMQHLVEVFEASFDLVIFDTPHLSRYEDANFLNAYTDGMLMVIGMNKTKRSTIMEILEELKALRLSTPGIVVNYVSTIN